jgi:hypothetical protein
MHLINEKMHDKQYIEIHARWHCIRVRTVRDYTKSHNIH